MVQSNIRRVANRIDELINQDKDTDKTFTANYIVCLSFIRSHLMKFFARYSEKNHLSIGQVSKQATTWDNRQWINAVKQVNMSNWSVNAIQRVKLYANLSRLSTLHTMEAIISLAMLQMTENNRKVIDDRITQDGYDEQQLASEMVGLGHKQQSNVQTIITQQKTRDIWSNNLWIDSDSMANDVQTLVNKHLRHGMSLKDMDSMLSYHANKSQFKPNQSVADRVKQMEFNARRIVRTESSRLIHQVNITTYKSAGITKVQLYPQNGACEKCLALADKTYKIDNSPVIPDDTHPNCRCIIIPVGDSHSLLITYNNLF